MLLAIALGGTLGSLARYAIAVAFEQASAGDLPWATLTVNVVGCLLIGILATRLGGAERPWLRPFVLTGVLGGFTTFSAFSLQTMDLLRSGAFTAAAANVLLSVLLCLAATALGHWLASPA